MTTRYRINIFGHVSPATPPGWVAVGEIVLDGERTGTLVRNSDTGEYAQASAEGIRPLDQLAVAYALAATVPGVDLDGDQLLTATEAAALVGQTSQAIKYWRDCQYITPVPGTRPAKYRKKDVIAAATRTMKLGRPPQKNKNKK